MLFCGCATLSPPPAVATGVPSDHRLTATPFVISTSFPLDANDSLVTGLNDLREQVERELQLPPSSRTIEIYVFDDRAVYDRFIQTNYPELPRRRAFFIAQDRREIVYAFRDDKLGEDLRHEATHAIVHAAVGRLPLWLDEGLAEYFETPATAVGLHDRHLAELHKVMATGWRPSLTRLEALTELTRMTGGDYREAWAWVYFLLNGPAEGRQLLLSYLRDRPTDEARGPLSARLFAVTKRPDSAMLSFLSRLEPTRSTAAESPPLR